MSLPGEFGGKAFLLASAEIDLLAYLTALHFGQRQYGAIYGWQYSVFALGYGLSPFALGLMRDANGDYDLALTLSASLVGGAALLMLGLRGAPRTSDCPTAPSMPSTTA